MKKAEIPSITAGQATYILEKAIGERKITAADVRRYIAGMWEEMNFIERRLADLRDAGEPIRHPVRTVRVVRDRVARAARRVGRKVSAEVQASRALQGRYISMIRRFPKNQRAKFAAIAKKDGREAAISAMSKSRG